MTASNPIIGLANMVTDENNDVTYERWAEYDSYAYLTVCDGPDDDSDHIAPHEAPPGDPELYCEWGHIWPPQEMERANLQQKELRVLIFSRQGFEHATFSNVGVSAVIRNVCH